MRIGIACNSYGRSGGMEQYALNVIEALIHLGHTPVVFTMSADVSLPFFSQTEVHLCPKKKWLPNKLNVVRFNHWLKKVRQTVPVDFMIACCIAVTAEVAVCGGNHIGYLKAMKKSPRFFDRWIINLEREMYGNAKFIVAHSKMMFRELQAFYHVPADRMKVMYVPQVFKEVHGPVDKRALRERFHLPQDKTLFLFPSSSHKRKGFDFLREYFESSDGSQVLVVVGKPLKKTYKNIIYAGYCDDMQSMYQAVDYTVMASIYEPFGLVPVESVWNGTPAIVSDNMGCCEVLDERSCCMFRAGDIYNFCCIMNQIRNGLMALTCVDGVKHIDAMDDHVRSIIFGIMTIA